MGSRKAQFTVYSPVRFNKCLKIGKKAEQYIAQMYHENFYPTGEFMFHDGKSYDIIFVFPRKKEIKIEVKHDRAAKKYGNVCLELFDYESMPSGIMATQADLMVFVISDKLGEKGEQILEFDVRGLRDFVCTALAGETQRIVKGGDDGAQTLMLVPIKEIVKESFCMRVTQ